MNEIGFFTPIDLKQKLMEGIEIPQEHTAMIQELMPKILNKELDPRIKWFCGRNKVFRLKNEDGNEVGHIFKLARYNINSRFENMLKAEEICLLHKLNLLVIPRAKIFDITVQGNDTPVTYQILAEEVLDIQQSQSAQEELYRTCSRDLNNAVRQLAIFIAKTGYQDVEWRNNPVLNASRVSQGDRRIGLIDLEVMGNAQEGFSGGDARGLIRCVATQEQMEMVIAEAARNGTFIPNQDLQWVRNRRLAEIEKDQELIAFHNKKGISQSNAREPLMVDIGTLGLDLNATCWDDDDIREITLREVVNDRIAKINEIIAGHSPEESVKGSRQIDLMPFKNKKKILLDGKRYSTCEISDQWDEAIFQALVATGHLFEYNEEKYYLQA